MSATEMQELDERRMTQDASIRVGRELTVGLVAVRSAMLVLIVAVVAYFAATEPAFRTLDNTLTTLASVATVGIIALGVTVSMVAGGFDLSIGANAGCSLMLCALGLVVFGLPAAVVVVLALVAGALIGGLNALLIVRLGVPDLLATLGMLFLLQGSQLLPSRGQTISTGVEIGGATYMGTFTHAFLQIGRGEVVGVPVPVVLFAVVAVGLWVLLERTVWGRMFYAVGGNAQAARLAGIRVERVRLAAYAISGILGALGGVILAARIGQGDVGAGSPFLLDAVAAALVGYTVLAVNRPNVLGTAIGAVFLGVLINGLTLKSLPYYTQDFVKGVILVLALLMTFGLGRRGAGRS